MSLTKVTYSMINGAPFNVLDYGADNTGTSDSTAAIQAAATNAEGTVSSALFVSNATTMHSVSAIAASGNIKFVATYTV